MICTTYFLTFFSELIPPTGLYYILALEGEKKKRMPFGHPFRVMFWLARTTSKINCLSLVVLMQI